MRKLLVAVVATLGLVGPVFAQGVPPGTSAPVYGSRAFPNAPYEPAFSKLFGHKTIASDNANIPVNKDADAAPAPR
jgi:hypothetical protein